MTVSCDSMLTWVTRSLCFMFMYSTSDRNLIVARMGAIELETYYSKFKKYTPFHK